MLLWNDLRFATRQLSKSPGFTLTVVLTLALCIGANTAIFSIIDAVFLRSLPYPEADRLAMVSTVYTKGSLEDIQTAQDGTQWQMVRDHVPLLDATPYSEGSGGVNLAVGNSAQYVQQQRVGAGFFRILGVPPAIGREFTREEDVPGGPPVAVLSHGLWQRLFQGDSAAVGRALQLRGEPYTIIGVMPKDFRTDAPGADLWTPLRPSTRGEGGGSNYGIVARIRGAASWAEANGQLATVFQPYFAKQKLPPGAALEQRAIPMQRARTGDMRQEFGLMWGAVGVVLLIGCVNIAGLLLARSASRRREIATRMALGAGRAAVVRQLMTEGLLLAVAGGALGLLVGRYALKLLQWLTGDSFAIWHAPSIDGRVMAATLGVSVLTSLVFGLLPALDATRVDIRSALAEGGRGLSGRRGLWKRQALVFVEVALGVMLVIGASLLIRTLTYLTGQNPGFDASHVYMASVSLQDARYSTSDSVNRFFRATIERIERIPGVESAAAALTGPYQRPLNMPIKRVSGRTAEPGALGVTNFTYATPRMFETLRIPVRRGRLFTDADGPKSQLVMVVNEAFVARTLRGLEPLGASVNIDGKDYTVVGVVGSVQQRNGFGENYGPMAAMPQAYVQAAQAPDGLMRVAHTWFAPNWIVRTRGDIPGLQESIRGAVASVDPLLPLSGFQRVLEARDSNLRPQRYRAFLFSALGGLALLLSALGIYGLIAQAVVERRREMGIRMALGASTSQILRSATGSGVAVALAGVLTGTGAAFLASSVLRSMIWGVQPNDTPTYAGAAAFLFAIACIASLLPALRLLGLDPVSTLREE